MLDSAALGLAAGGTGRSADRGARNSVPGCRSPGRRADRRIAASRIERTSRLRGCSAGSAITLAIVCAIDPAVTSGAQFTSRGPVVVIDSVTTRPLAASVARALSGKFTIIPAPFAAASATVLVGDRLPSSIADLASPVFAVSPDADGPTRRPSRRSKRQPERPSRGARPSLPGQPGQLSGPRAAPRCQRPTDGGSVVDQVRRRVVGDERTSAHPAEFRSTTATGARHPRVTAWIDSAHRALRCRGCADRCP